VETLGICVLFACLFLATTFFIASIAFNAKKEKKSHLKALFLSSWGFLMNSGACLSLLYFFSDDMALNLVWWLIGASVFFVVLAALFFWSYNLNVQIQEEDR